MPGTQVLMADGSSKPIEDIQLGDVVLATEGETGKTEAQPVTALIIGDGQKNLVRITIDTDGESGDRTDQVVATDGHPFWVQDLEKWTRADELTAGNWLRTSSGTYVQITAIEKWTQQQRVHNLTVRDLHTYYVLAGTVPVLAHNASCGEGPEDHVALGRDMRDGPNVRNFAERVEARHLMGSSDWQGDVDRAIARVRRGEGRISFMLDGLPGANRGSAVALQRAQEVEASGGNLMATQWELLRVARAGLMDKIDFYRWNLRLNDWGIVS